MDFTKMLPDAYQDIILHEVPQPIIKRDILAFLDSEFVKIREDYNVDPLSGTPLSDDGLGLDT